MNRNISGVTVALLLAVIICMCVAETSYIDSSAEAMIQKADEATLYIRAENTAEANRALHELNIMWNDNVKAWQSLQNHANVGKIYENLFLTNRSLEKSDFALAYSYITLTKYYIWDIYTLDKTAVENIF